MLTEYSGNNRVLHFQFLSEIGKGLHLVTAVLTVKICNSVTFDKPHVILPAFQETNETEKPVCPTSDVVRS